MNPAKEARRGERERLSARKQPTTAQIDKAMTLSKSVRNLKITDIEHEGPTAERLQQLGADAQSLEVLLRDYTQDERRILFGKLFDYVCRYCARLKQRDESCGCEARDAEIVTLLERHPGWRVEAGVVGDVLRVHISVPCETHKLGECRAVAAVKPLKEVVLRPILFKAMLLTCENAVLAKQAAH